MCLYMSELLWLHREERCELRQENIQMGNHLVCSDDKTILLSHTYTHTMLMFYLYFILPDGEKEKKLKECMWSVSDTHAGTYIHIYVLTSHTYEEREKLTYKSSQNSIDEYKKSRGKKERNRTIRNKRRNHFVLLPVLLMTLTSFSSAFLSLSLSLSLPFLPQYEHNQYQSRKEITNWILWLFDRSQCISQNTIHNHQ